MNITRFYNALKKYFIIIILLNTGTLIKGSIKELRNQYQLVKEILNTALNNTEYKITTDDLKIQFKPSTIIIIADTAIGKKFLKLHDRNNGKREFAGAMLMSKYIPTIKPECLISQGDYEIIVQPYIENINNKILFNVIEKLDSTFQNSLSLIETMFKQMFNLVSQNLDYSITSTKNDHLYINRLRTQEQDQESGRIESFYKNNKLNLAGLEIFWENLLNKKFIIDGISYQETLGDILKNAIQHLDPKKSRIISICHGDWHEMNIFVESLEDSPYFCLLDCEYSGINDVIGDAIVYLIYNSVLTAYLGPKYFPEQFYNISGLELTQKRFEQKIRNINATLYNQETIILNGINNFGTSYIRKEISKLFIKNYLNPIIEKAQQKFDLNFNDIEKKIRACIILRLLGVYNISLMEPMDQAKIIGLLFKVIGTPIRSTNKISILTRLEESI